MINLSEPTGTPQPTATVYSNVVPNKFPTVQTELPYRVAIIGESPGADEVVGGQPFVGASGRLLDYLLNRVGILRSGCFLGNICQHRPPDNKINLWNWNDKRIQDGLVQLQEDLDKFNPNLCVLLGGTGLAAAQGLKPNWAVRKNEKDARASVQNMRGSLFLGTALPFLGRKCISTFHPAAALRVYDYTPLILFDLKRARSEATSRDLLLPHREISVVQTPEEFDDFICRIRSSPRRNGTDIEGYVDNLTCISFSERPSHGIVVPFTGGRGANYWSPEEELRVWLSLKSFLEDPNIPFVLQNGLYDRFVLAYTYGILCTNVKDDTLVKHWELYCELEKKLSVQISLYTKEPYYKDERDAEDWNTHWQYNGKDSCCTLECSDVQDAMLSGPAKGHYHFNMDMQNPLLYMELRGIKYDKEKSTPTRTGSSKGSIRTTAPSQRPCQ
jgi:uracil-DNA glycosylase family 4